MKWEDLYKGFIIADGKIPGEKFKGINEFKSYDEIKNYTSFAGILRDDVILIDIDDADQSEILLNMVDDLEIKCRVYQTARGKHFLFKNSNVDKCYNHCNLACGLIADIKTGGLPEAIKVDEVERKIIYDKFDDEEYDELPYWLKPLKTKKDFVGLEDGDGRNPNIYGYELVLMSNKLSVEQCRFTIRLINKYVFKEPMSEKELETLLRDEAFDAYNCYLGDPKDMIEFAEWLCNRLKVKWYKGNLYYYDENKKIYLNDNMALLRESNKYLKLKRNQDNEFMYQMTKYCEIIQDDEFMPIRFKNKILTFNADTNKREIIEITDDIFTVFNLDVVYDEDAYDESVDNFLNDITCDKKELRNILEEILGHILITNNLPAYVFFLKGNGKNGKSTFEEMINNFVKDLGSNMGLEDFNDATSVASLIGKLVNCTDETDSVYIERCKGYKSLASGNSIQVRPIYSKPVKVRNTATLILNANKMPNFKDKTGGFFRRLEIIPFDYDLEENPEKINDNLLKDLSTSNAKSYILNLALKGLKRIENNKGKISESEILKQEKMKYRIETDSVVAFVSNTEESRINKCPADEVYLKYQTFCTQEGTMAVSRTEFTFRLKEFKYIVKVMRFKDAKGESHSKRAYCKL